MTAVIVIAAFLGFFFGVVVNALADSLPATRSVSVPRCSHCGGPRSPLAWSGILGWIIGKRACAYCSRKRGLRAAVVEIVTVGAAGVLAMNAASSEAIFVQLFVFSLYALIAVIDIEHRLILHIVSGPAALVIGLIGVIDPNLGVTKTLLGGVAGFGLFFGLYLLGGVFAMAMSRLRGREIDEVAFGFGDVTLAGVIGLTVGWPGVLAALVLGILAAGLFSMLFIATMVLRRNYNPFMPIPYGPFLILGALFVYFDGVSFIANSL